MLTGVLPLQEAGVKTASILEGDASRGGLRWGPGCFFSGFPG